MKPKKRTRVYLLSVLRKDNRGEKAMKKYNIGLTKTGAVVLLRITEPFYYDPIIDEWRPYERKVLRNIVNNLKKVLGIENRITETRMLLENVPKDSKFHPPEVYDEEV